MNNKLTETEGSSSMLFGVLILRSLQIYSMAGFVHEFDMRMDQTLVTYFEKLLGKWGGCPFGLQSPLVYCLCCLINSVQVILVQKRSLFQLMLLLQFCLGHGFHPLSSNLTALSVDIARFLQCQIAYFTNTMYTLYHYNNVLDF